MQLYVKLYTVPMICVKRKIFTFTSSPYKIGSRERKFSTDFKNDLKTSYALLRCRIFARHKVWKIYFGGNDLGSENSQMGDIGPLILSCKNVYALDIQLDRLQFTEPRASCISCYFGLLMVQYSCTIPKKNKKNPEAMVHFQYCTA